MPKLNMVSNSISPLYGHSISQEKTVRNIGRLFMVEIDINMHGVNFATSFYDLIPGETIEGVWKEFATGGRNADLVAIPRPSGSAFEIHFGAQPCHVVFILNAGEWKFAEDDANKPDVEETVVFRRNKIVIDYSTHKPVNIIDRYDKNYSFYNLQRHSLQNSKGVNIDVISFDNFMTKNSKGNAISTRNTTDDFSKFCMDLYLKVPLEQIFGHHGLQFFRKLLQAPVDGGGARMPLKFPFTRDNDLIVVFDPPQWNGGGGGPP